MLLLAFGAAEDGENGHTESMPDEMGCPIFTRRPESDQHFPGWKTIRATTGMKHIGSLLHIISAQICELGITLASETMHWLLNVHYGEDYCRIENRTIQQNLSLLRKFSISLLKQYKVRISSKRAMSKIMLDCLLESSKICEVLEN